MSNENKREILTKNINNWKAKLLDLSMKNKALNFNVYPAKTIVPKIKIVSPVLDDFIKIINSSSKEEFEINSYKMSSLYARDQYGQTKTFYSHTINDILSKNPNIAKSKIYCEYGNSATQNLLDNTLKKNLQNCQNVKRWVFNWCAIFGFWIFKMIWIKGFIWT
nr:DUF4011 domain-containing protein [Mycoplasmopsis bovis]